MYSSSSRIDGEHLLGVLPRPGPGHGSKPARRPGAGQERQDPTSWWTWLHHRPGAWRACAGPAGPLRWCYGYPRGAATREGDSRAGQPVPCCRAAAASRRRGFVDLAGRARADGASDQFRAPPGDAGRIPGAHSGPAVAVPDRGRGDPAAPGRGTPAPVAAARPRMVSLAGFLAAARVPRRRGAGRRGRGGARARRAGSGNAAAPIFPSGGGPEGFRSPDSWRQTGYHAPAAPVAAAAEVLVLAVWAAGIVAATIYLWVWALPAVGLFSQAGYTFQAVYITAGGLAVLAIAVRLTRAAVR